MKEIRYVKVYDGKGNLISEEPYEVSDDELHQEELVKQSNDDYVALLEALQNWNKLTAANRNEVLRKVLWYVLYREGLL